MNGVTQITESMRTAFNQNHNAYASALGAVDGHIAVLRAVINDLHRGEVQVDGEGNINWATYYEWYNAHVKQEAEEASRKNQEGGTVLVTPEEVDEEVFGGDYGG